MPCCTATVRGDHVSIGRLPTFDVFQDLNEILNLIIKVGGDCEIVKDTLPNRESSTGNGEGVAAVEDGGCLGGIGDHGAVWLTL